MEATYLVILIMAFAVLAAFSCYVLRRLFTGPR
jgi:hypothetical protein